MREESSERRREWRERSKGEEVGERIRGFSERGSRTEVLAILRERIELSS